MRDRLQIFVAKLKALFGPSWDDAAFNEEIGEHLALLVERYERRGMSVHEARRAARRQFGNVTLLTQKRKEARTTMFFSGISRDLRYGVRQLMKTPVFTVVCVLTLALGIGANTAVFSVMYAVLAKMLPVQNASQVVYVHTSDLPDGASNSGDINTSFSYATYRELREHSGLEEVIGFIPMSTTGKAPVRVTELPEAAAGDMVSGNYFSGLGVGTELGRGFMQKDEDDHAAVTVISEKFWTTHYARRRDVIGRTLFIKSYSFTIVGVAAKGFEGTEGRLPLDFWIPLQNHPDFNAWGSPVSEDGNYLTISRFWCMRLMARIPGLRNGNRRLPRRRVSFNRQRILASRRGVQAKRSLSYPFFQRNSSTVRMIRLRAR